MSPPEVLQKPGAPATGMASSKQAATSTTAPAAKTSGGGVSPVDATDRVHAVSNSSSSNTNTGKNQAPTAADRPKAVVNSNATKVPHPHSRYRGAKDLHLPTVRRKAAVHTGGGGGPTSSRSTTGTAGVDDAPAAGIAGSASGVAGDHHAATELDDAFLGLGITEPGHMIPFIDFRHGKEPAPDHRGDLADLTPPKSHALASSGNTVKDKPATTKAAEATATSPVPEAAAAASSSAPSGSVMSRLLTRKMSAHSPNPRQQKNDQPPEMPKDAVAGPGIRPQLAPKAEPTGPVTLIAPVSPPQQSTAPSKIPTVSRAFAPRSGGGSQAGTVTIRMDQIKQTIQGIGFSNAFYTNWWHTAHPFSAEIYGLFLGDLQPSMLRLRNNYGINAESDMKTDVEFLQTARRLLGYSPLVLMTGWSPPASLKVNGQLLGAGSDPSKNVIGKDSRGRFLYYDFAQYWVKSLQAYAAVGVVPDFFSPQNEPDYSTPSHATCLFGAQETFSIPGYFEAAREVYREVHKAIRNPPAMIGPESFGMDQYIAEFPFGGGGMFAAVANHLYASGTAPDQSFDPYSFSPALVRAKQYALGKGIQTLWMSEYAKLSGFEYQDPLRLAIIMHNALTLADVSVYLHWDGAWGAPSNGPATEGTLILVENPFADRSTWQYPKGYKILHTYWWIKHFTRFVRPTYRRVQCDISGLNNVLISAWTGANGVFSIILINTGSVQAEVSLRQLPSWIAIQNTDRYYSTLDIGFTYAGRFYGDFISIPPLSITSLFSYAPA